METTASGGIVPRLFPSLGPVLLISMGYVDLGKWVAAVEGGALFGYDLVLLVLFFNFTAILCQYLATLIGMVSGKNLAEICSEEYSKSACMLLGVQAELSMITSKLTTILGTAYGLNLLLGVDLFSCIFLAAIVAVLLPLFVTMLDNKMAEALYVSIAGFALLFYVLGVLISQPEIPLTLNVIFPKLSGESAYSLMALLGANLMAHNFYIHSAIVQQQQMRQPSIAMSALLHDHFFAILFIFTGIFLVYYVLMNSAVAVFGTADDMLGFQDVSLLMDQIFRTPIAPTAFFLVLFFSGQITSLTWNIGGQVILQNFFGINPPVWVHRLLVKALTVIPALFCAKIGGAEGIYRLLIVCQVIQALLLPSSVIPLFRVASSRFIMGAFKISWSLEILALLAFFGMLASNIIFIAEMLFGNSSWTDNVKGSMGSSVMIHIALVLIACTSFAFTLYLAVTPLKSASDGTETQVWSSHSQEEQLELSEGREDNDLDKVIYEEDQVSAVEPALELESISDKSTLESSLDQSETATESDHDSHRAIHVSNTTIPFTSPAYHPEETKSVVEDNLETVDKASTVGLSDAVDLQNIELKDPIEKAGEDANVHTDKGNEEGDTLEPEESLGGPLPYSTSEGPGSLNSGKGGSGSGSLSKLSGLGRAARRQLAAILDEFWGHLFDFHGKVTQEASTKKYDVLLGLDLKLVSSSVKVDSAESSKNFFRDLDRGPVFPAKQMDYDSPRQKKNSSLDLLYGVQMGSPSWSQNMQTLNTHVQSSYSSLNDPNQKSYSSLQLPPYSDSRDYQPATIHGYQIASYLKGIGAGRTPYSSNISLDPPPTSKSASSYIPNVRDSLMYTRGQNGLVSVGTSGLESPTASQISRLQGDRPYYNPSSIEPSEGVGTSSYTKKYHSSPDISALIAAGRNSLLHEGRWGGPIGPQPSLGRMASEQSQYLNPISPMSKTRVPLAFDELSPPKIHRNVFSVQSNLNPDTKSLWSRQPYEQLFGVMNFEQRRGETGVTHKSGIAPRETFSYAESETKLLQSLRFCIVRLLKLEGSDWLFRQNGGLDEELIDRVAACLHEADAGEVNQLYTGDTQHLSSDRTFSPIQRSEEVDSPYILSLSNCGDGCVWRAALVVSFGVWCIRRILELSLVESRPELWGKYTYVLNRLQGIIDPAFSKPRHPLAACTCLEVSSSNQLLSNGLICRIPRPINGSFTSACMVLDIIKDVEIAVSCRKGRTGTAAGDVAFPKGKENLASVLKRYRRRLSNKFPGTQEGTPSRKIPSPATSSV